jgi:hypothetical protein
MRFTKATVDALIAKVAPATMADCFIEPLQNTIQRAMQYNDVSIDDMARLPNLTHPGNPHFVYVDKCGYFRSCYFTGIYTAKDPAKTKVNLIILRFIKLMGHNSDIPISVFRDTKGTTHNIVRTDVDSVLQSTVKRHFQLDPVVDKETVHKWTSHSIRVGACNILFGAGQHETVIKFRLRWRSMAFMNYFRNLGAMSQQQNTAVNMAIDHPDLFY